MAKKQQATEAEVEVVEAPEAAVEVVTPAPVAPPADLPLEIVLKRDVQVGDRQRKAGEKLGTVVLEEGVSLGYLTRACEDGIAGQKS